MIRASGIRKAYGNLEVLKGVDLEVRQGEIVSIVGDSGAGKTTLLQILGTLDKPDHGTLSIHGQSIENLSRQELSRFRNQEIGFVYQFHHLLPEFTAIENICLPAMIAKEDLNEAKKRGLDLLELLNLSERAEHKPSQMSGGEQQRVAVARALINNPAVVFADEPSGNLDSKNADQLHQLFFDLRDKLGQTFVIVTHNPELAEMADRKLKMVDGIIAK